MQEQSKSVSELVEESDKLHDVFGVSVSPQQSLPADVRPSSDNKNKSNGQGTPVVDEKTWECINARRCDLIRRKYTEELTGAEQAELDSLEEAATKYLDTIAPLPNYPLDALQAQVDRIKTKQKNGS